MGSFEINNDIRAFMVEQFGGWHFIIRKYKQKVKVGEKPHFEFNIPAEDMPKVAVALRYYIHMRELGREPDLETNEELAPYKNVDIVRRIMTPKIVVSAPPLSQTDGNNNNEEHVQLRKRPRLLE